MNASLMAIIPTFAGRSTRYQQGWPRRVMELSMMSSETRKNAWSCGNGVSRWGRPWAATYELDAPAEYGGLGVFLVRQLAAKEDLGRVHDRYTSVEFPSGRIVFEILNSDVRSRLNGTEKSQYTRVNHAFASSGMSFFSRYSSSSAWIKGNTPRKRSFFCCDDAPPGENWVVEQEDGGRLVLHGDAMAVVSRRSSCDKECCVERWAKAQKPLN